MILYEDPKIAQYTSKLKKIRIMKGLTQEQLADLSDVNIKSALGDIWICGNHRVMCGDSTSFDDVEKLMGGIKPIY